MIYQLDTQYDDWKTSIDEIIAVFGQPNLLYLPEVSPQAIADIVSDIAPTWNPSPCGEVPSKCICKSLSIISEILERCEVPEVLIMIVMSRVSDLLHEYREAKKVLN